MNYPLLIEVILSWIVIAYFVLRDMSRKEFLLQINMFVLSGMASIPVALCLEFLRVTIFR